MNYEEKYKALVNAIKVLKETNPSDVGIRNWVNDNVPELRESEDEKVRKELLSHCIKAANGETIIVSTDDYYRWSKWLEKQDQKYVWSEEDEEIIHNIRMFIEKYAISQSAVNVNGELCEKEYIDADNWLKFLKQRYAWKPSKEQMEALEHFIIHHNGSTNYAKDLEELRIQLKKL